MTVREIQTKPYTDQRPGTAGLRKKVVVFQQPHYLENFLQAIFDVEPSLRDATLVIGGDGRFHNREAIQTAIAMAAANGVARVVVARGGLLSTPAASNLIRVYGAAGGFLFTASHNPAGPDGDFGIKFNIAGGGQAPEALTERIFERSRTLPRYRIAAPVGVDLDTCGDSVVEAMQVHVVDGIDDYARMMQSLFDFDRIRAWLKSGHRLCFDAMHAATGPYAQRLLVEQLGAPADSVRNAVPLADFGGGHPDPNLIYAKALVETAFGADAPDLCAASDGDGDRNMILGPRLFISPGDSLAMLAAQLDALPGYRGRIRGFARSMPTSRAVDHVARELGCECHETPTGWKFFCNLLDADRVTLCGEESFGTGSDHVREKDGLWAVLAWLNVLALRDDNVNAIADAHWRRFGRHYYARHDYENLDAGTAQGVMEALRGHLPTLPGASHGEWRVTQADSFDYTDPTDGSMARDQGLRVVFGEQARVVLRASGTGTAGATLRLYLERYVPPNGTLNAETKAMLAPLATVAEQIIGIAQRTGRKSPSLVT